MRPRILAISPHLDDAVLSAGGHLARLAASGADVTVHTIFAGLARPPYSPAARWFHADWGLAGDVVERRRHEDRRALEWLGAMASHGDALDVIYRTDAGGSWLLGDGVWPTACDPGREPGVLRSVVGQVGAVLRRLAPDRVLTCAAVGDHVDHRLTRDAVLAAIDPSGHDVLLWTDVPYASGAAVAAAADVAAAAGFPCPCPEPVGDREWAAKRAAVGCYRSQLSMLWRGAGDPLEALEAQAVALGSSVGLTTRCELLWRRETRPASTR